MFGRSKEARIYTEDDLFRASIDFLKHGDIPPKEIGTVNGVLLTMKSREEVEAVNMAAREKNAQMHTLENARRQQREQKTGTVRKALAAFGTVFVR